MEQDISIGAVLCRRNKRSCFLIVKRRDNSIWEFPKGHPKNGEKELDALKRELSEEIGIKNYEVINGFRETISYLNSKGKERIFVFYLICTKDKIKLSEEHTEYKWISLPEAENYFEYDDVIEILRKASLKI